MENKEPKFKDVKVGDKVYDILWGEGIVNKIVPEQKFSIYVNLINGTAVYSIKGFQSGAEFAPRLYWSKPEIIEQKRMVTKTVERWVNIYNYEGCNSYNTKEKADRYKSDDRIACVKLTGTYEVEE